MLLEAFAVATGDFQATEPEYDANTVEPCEGLDKSSIAELRASTLNEMTGAELIRVIQAAGLPGVSHCDLDQRPESYDRTRLLRLAHIVRRCCRHQGY